MIKHLSVQSTAGQLEFIYQPRSQAKIAKNQPKAQRICTNEELTRYDKMIHLLINKYLITYCNRGTGHEYQDFFQIGRTLVWQALYKFNPDRNTKESTWVFQVLTTKFINLGKKLMLRRNPTPENVVIEERDIPVLGEDDIISLVDVKAGFDSLELEHQLATLDKYIGKKSLEVFLNDSLKSAKRKLGRHPKNFHELYELDAS